MARLWVATTKPVAKPKRKWKKRLFAFCIYMAVFIPCYDGLDDAVIAHPHTVLLGAYMLGMVCLSIFLALTWWLEI